MDPLSADRDPLEILADDFLARRRRGESPQLREYIEKYPNLADEIRDLFPTLQLMDDAAPGTVDLKAGSGSTVSDSGLKRLERVGDYRILKEIGRGAMGVVYEAEQASLGRRVALKVLPRQLSSDEKALGRFRREARAAARLHHTNIVPVFEVGQDGETLFYAMQYIQGQSLDKVLAELRRIRNGTQAELAEGVGNAEALTAALSLCRGRFGAVGSEPSNLGEKTENNAAGARCERAASEDAHADDRSATAADSGATKFAEGLSGAQPQLQAYIRSIATIGEQAASALSYAHERDTVHRDIKPSNLLLDTNGVLWVADFGLAKFEDDGHTRTGDLVGTLRYMSPERFEGRCDARADVYSLGVTLYELLLLQPAFTSTNQLELMDQISNLEPRRPRAVESRIPRDLETIVIKAMEKEPTRRYQSARQMEEDLHRFLEDEPIQARKATLAERFVRWVRRNRISATLAAATTALLVVLAAVSTIYAVYLQEANRERAIALDVATEARGAAEQKELEERQARVAAQAATKEARRLRYLSDMYAAQFAWEANNVAMVDRILDRCRPVGDEEDLRGFEWYYLWRARRNSPATGSASLSGSVVRVAVSPNGQLLASASWQGAYCTLWDLQSNSKIDEFGTRDITVFVDTFASFSADSRTLAYPSADFKQVVLRDVETREERCVPGSFGLFSPTESVLVTLVEGNKLRLWDSRTLEHVTDLPVVVSSRSAYLLHPTAFSRDGRQLAVATDVHEVVIIDMASRQLKATFRGFTSPILSLAFSPNGERLASGTLNGDVQVWDAAGGPPLHGFPTLPDEARAVAFSPDGKLLAAGGRDGAIRLWDSESFADHGLIREYEGSYALCFLPDNRLAYGSSSGTVICGIRGTPPEKVSCGGDGIAKNDMVLTNCDGRVLSCAIARSALTANLVRIWRVDQPQVEELPPITLEFDAACIAATGDGLLAVGEESGHRVAIYDLARMQLRQQLVTKAASWPLGVAFSPEGSCVAVGCEDGNVAVWKLGQDGRFDADGLLEFNAHSGRVWSVAFHPNGSALATGGFDCRLKVWNVDDGELVADFGDLGDWVHSVAFTSRGDRLAASTFWTPDIKIWSWPSREEICTLRGHRVYAGRITFLQGGETLVSAGADRVVKIWDLKSQQERFNLKGGSSIFECLAVSPDEKTIAAGARDGTVHFFRTASEEDVRKEDAKRQQ